MPLQKWQPPILTFKRGVNIKSVSQGSALCMCQRSILRLHYSHLSKTFSWNKMPHLASWPNDPVEQAWNIWMLNNTQDRCDASAADSLRSKRRPSRADHGSETRFGVNWKHSPTASSLRRFIGEEISRSSKIYKDTHEDKGTRLNMIGAGRWDDTKYTSDWGNTVILTQTNSPLLKKKREMGNL